MAVNLIGPDIQLIRNRYDEALEMRGIPVKYQYPLKAQSNAEGEPVIDSYSEMISTYVFVDGNPKVKTYKRYGWVVENDKDLPMLIHFSFHLPNAQKDCLFRIAGQYAGIPERVFRATELSYDLQAPDHLVAQVVPVYDEQAVGRTPKEVQKTYDTSNHFLNPQLDYRGDYHTTRQDMDDNFPRKEDTKQ